MRTKNSIKNMISVLIPYLIIGALGFVKAKVFVTSFDDDIYSLNQLFFQIIGYLSLAEAGFAVFIAQKYYKAFLEKNYDEVNDLFSTSVIYFKKVGYFVLTLSFCLMFFFPFLTKSPLNTIYILFVFILLHRDASNCTITKKDCKQPPTITTMPTKRAAV